ncbi:DUF4402 domain-containing protein [uncultured Parasphingopyxis sp.]|uniref:DUF4402 domain-containing protein n=1 Tax=uncultured Parasphingopyxis sp. TaxID=1547918 RepID=UPI002629A9D1|nr:DUF4402 domain-containing protein [uncultured Parasphingopyxis sp.]
MASGGAWAAPAAAQTSGQVNINIMAPVALSRVDDLEFGRLTPGAAGGVVTINPGNGARTTTGSVVGAGGGYNPAHFQANGLVNLIALVRLPNNIVLQRVGGGGNMRVRNMTVAGGGLPMLGGAIPVTIGTGGTLDLYIGGDLEVDPNQATGVYERTFQITVNYL